MPLGNSAKKGSGRVNLPARFALARKSHKWMRLSRCDEAVVFDYQGKDKPYAHDSSDYRV
jgi:hypothetical protein